MPKTGSAAQASKGASSKRVSKGAKEQGSKVAKTGSAAQARRTAEQVSARPRAPVEVERAPSCHHHARSDF